jgi:hypothetical protein
MDATTTLSNYTSGLAPAFIAGFGVQQAVEIFDSLVTWLSNWDPSDAKDTRKKKALLSCVSVIIATVLVVFGAGQIDVLKPFFDTTSYRWGLLSGIITVIFISAGTEGFNSLTKWMSYQKETAKVTAAQAKGASAGGAAAGLKIMPS